MKMQVLSILMVFMVFTATPVMAAEKWSEEIYTEQWSEPPATTEQWSNPPEPTDLWADPGETKIIFDVMPRMEKGRSLVPLRKIFEVLGAEVKWDTSTQIVTAVKGERIIKLKMESKTAYINNKAVTLEVPPKLWQGRTLVPLRFVSEALGSKVGYDSVTTKVTIDNKYYFYIENKAQNNNQGNSNSTQNTGTASKSYIGKWAVWVSGGWTAPDPVTGISTFTKGAAGGSLTIKQDGTFIWDMKTAVYEGVWVNHPSIAGNLILKSSDGWDYTLTRLDAKTIKWYTYGLEYYGTHD